MRGGGHMAAVPQPLEYVLGYQGVFGVQIRGQARARSLSEAPERRGIGTRQKKTEFSSDPQCRCVGREDELCKNPNAIPHVPGTRHTLLAISVLHEHHTDTHRGPLPIIHHKRDHSHVYLSIVVSICAAISSAFSFETSSSTSLSANFSEVPGP